MEIELRVVYSPEEQNAIGRGESDLLDGIDVAKLGAQVEERCRKFKERRNTDEKLTPGLNESLLQESRALQVDKLIVRGVSEELTSWREEHSFPEPISGQTPMAG